MPFQWLLLDVLVEILSYLEVRDILALQRSCKNIRDVTQLRAVWKNVLEKQIIPSGKPLSLPSNVSPSNLSARDLQKAAIYAMRLEDNWSSRVPIAFSHTEFDVNTPTTYVQIAFLLPFQGGKYLLAISGGNTVSIWHLEPALRRSRRILSWETPGAILDAVPNTDNQDRGTIALSYITNRYTTLYNLSFIENESGLPTAHCEQVFQEELPGRLKILRGNLIGFHRRSRIYLFNYHNQVTIICTSPTNESRPACLAIEVLGDCVITVQLQTVNIFQLPGVARDNGPRSPEAARDVSAPLISTAHRPPDSTSEWHSAVIVPYCPLYPAERQSPITRPISILVREKLATLHSMRHYQIFHPPRTILADSNSPPMSISTTVRTIQVHRIRPHFFSDVVVSPTTGRGLWLENATSPGMSGSSEHLMIFYARQPNRFAWPSVDIGQPDKFGKSCGGVRSAAQNIPNVVRNCSYCSFDDGSGRVVVATHDGHIRVLQFGTV